MNASLRALLTGAIDYAGMFPPAGLPLGRAIDSYRQYRGSKASWMLGRLVIPAAQLADLAAMYDRERDGRLTVVVPGADSSAVLLKNLDQLLTCVGRFPAAGAIDMLEFRWPVDSVRDSDASRLVNLVQAAAGQIVASRLPSMTMFFELPRPEALPVDAAPLEARSREIRAAAAALAEFNQSARGLNCLAGFKLRCGGTQPSDVPSSAEVALAICACRDSGVFWKATAGLHHPLCHTNSEGWAPAHGFLNLVCAAVLAEIHGLDERCVQTLIEESDQRQFKFSDAALAWRERAVPTEKIAAARERSFRSFGSCSFDEPCDDLDALGLM